MRIARVAVPGVAYHVTQRGNNRQDVFFVDDDRTAYIELLKEESGKYGLEIHGYCLMTNHIHLIAIPREEDSLARALGRAHFRYTQYINRLHGRSGHLWQNRFYSCPLEMEHYLSAMRYIERNPVRAGLAKEAWKYRWSSAAVHVGEGDEHGMVSKRALRMMPTEPEWRKALKSKDDKAGTERLRLSTSTGRPLGSDMFISKLEVKLGRRLRPLPIGRPRKEKKTTKSNKINR